MMKAAVVVSPGVVEIRDVPLPEPGAYEALVKIEACGLCGTTDRHIVAGHQPHHPTDWYPAILGHEAIGTVVETGGKVRKFRVGDRVTRPVAIWPGTHQGGYYSAWGGFAEYGIVRDSTAEGAPAPDYTSQREHVVAPDLSLEDGTLAISLSEVASWMHKLGDIRDRTIIIGGTGFAACVMSQYAKIAGARTIIAFGRSPNKLAWVLRNGATHALVINESTKQEIWSINHGGGADWFLDAAGHQEVFEFGLGCLRPGGQAAIYGAPDGFSYRLPLGAVGGDFAVHYLAPADDTFFSEASRQIAAKLVDANTLRTHIWHGLPSIFDALHEQETGLVLKGLIRIGQ